MSVPLSSDVVRRFLEVVVRQLRATVGVDAVVAAMGDTVDDAAIAVAVDFSGDVRGPVTWVFPQAIALELVRRLMSDPDPDPETASDGATELANILTGHASAALEAHGFHCAFGVPRLHMRRAARRHLGAHADPRRPDRSGAVDVDRHHPAAPRDHRRDLSAPGLTAGGSDRPRSPAPRRSAAGARASAGR
jgi:CheY-specific phosphatase CheX